MANHADNAQVKSQAKGSTGKKVAIAVVAILGVIVVYCALLVGRVLQAKKHLTQAVSIVQSANIGSDMTSDLSALTGKTAQLQQETKAARSQTDGIVWRIGTVIPYFGDDLSAARTAVTALDTVSNDVIPAVSDSLTNLQKKQRRGQYTGYQVVVIGCECDREGERGSADAVQSLGERAYAAYWQSS